MTKRTSASARIERTGVAVAAVLGGLVGIQPALGQDADRVTVDVGECVDLASREERLACYETQVDAALQERPAPTAAEQASRPAAAAPVGTTAAGEGAPASAAAAPSGETAASASPSRPDNVRAEELGAEPREFTATITALRQTVPNSFLITLDNGQVWRQMRPQWYPLRPGQTVRIYPTSWGKAFRLSVEGLNGFIQVERAK